MKEYKEYRVKVFEDKTEWYNLEGERHREEGPAVEYGNKYWYINGKKYTEEEFLKKTKQSCAGKIVEFEGKKYRLEEIS